MFKVHLFKNADESSFTSFCDQAVLSFFSVLIDVHPLSSLTTNQILEERKKKNQQAVQSAKHTSTRIIGQFLVSATQKRPVECPQRRR